MEVIKNDMIHIPAGCYSGYLWKSDQKPNEIQVFKKEVVNREILLDASENPFVIEGQLYDESNRVSYSLKYMDGLYWQVTYYLKSLEEEKLESQEHSYLAAFDHAPGKLLFREYWRKNADQQCLGFDTLLPSEFIFVGFKE